MFGRAEILDTGGLVIITTDRVCGLDPVQAIVRTAAVGYAVFKTAITTSPIRAISHWVGPIQTWW